MVGTLKPKSWLSVFSESGCGTLITTLLMFAFSSLAFLISTRLVLSSVNTYNYTFISMCVYIYICVYRLAP